MQLDAAALTTTGRRANNEDSHLVCTDLGLFAVADGMGGYDRGEIASRVALDEIETFIRALKSDRDRTWPNAWDPNYSLGQNLLDQAIGLAHRAVVAARPEWMRAMGTTVAAVVLEGDLLAIGHVGDSRVYRWRGGVLEQLTRDHSVVEELRASGVIGPDDVPASMLHYVTQALGIEGFKRATVNVDRPEPGDRYLLCTDGLSGALEPAEIAELLAYPSRQAAAEKLVHAALEGGSNDNITAVVIGVS